MTDTNAATTPSPADLARDAAARLAELTGVESHDVALVVADTAGRWPLAEDLTSDFVYVRLHGDKELYASGYSPSALDGWAETIRGCRADADVFAYFDNDIKGYAPHYARGLIERLSG